MAAKNNTVDMPAPTDASVKATSTASKVMNINAATNEYALVKSTV